MGYSDINPKHWSTFAGDINKYKNKIKNKLL